MTTEEQEKEIARLKVLIKDYEETISTIFINGMSIGVGLSAIVVSVVVLFTR